MRLGVQIGDQVTVVLTLDEAPREVPVPVELEQALASDPAAGAAEPKRDVQQICAPVVDARG